MTGCAVVGSPISHSLSPAMHRAAYLSLGLDWAYDAHDVPAGGLAAFAAGQGSGGGLAGLSVTMPLKREAARLADHRSDDVAYLGVANTLVRGDDGWTASNTDIPGAIAALREHGIERIDSVRIIGGGATAVSLTVAAHRLGASRVRYAVREPARAAQVARIAAELGLDETVERLDGPLTEGADLIVSTVPVAALAGREHELAGSAAAVFEIVYDPHPTPLMVAARERGATVVGGLDLLAHQAALQVLAMTGEPVGADLLREAAMLALEERP